MPKRTGKKKGKKKANKTNERDMASVQLGSIANRTMVQQMASESLSVASSSRDGLSSKERVRVKKIKYSRTSVNSKTSKCALRKCRIAVLKACRVLC